MSFKAKSKFIKVFMVFLDVLDKNMLKLIFLAKKTRADFLATKGSLETKPINNGSPILFFL